jgi:hypothetical protein
MFSDAEIRSTSPGFGRFLTQLGCLVLFGLGVWAALFAAALWQHEQDLRPGAIASANSDMSTEYSVLSTHVPAAHP